MIFKMIQLKLFYDSDREFWSIRFHLSQKCIKSDTFFQNIFQPFELKQLSWKNLNTDFGLDSFTFLGFFYQQEKGEFGSKA